MGPGVGAVLTVGVFDRCDSVAVPCYLGAGRAHLVAYYRKHGFGVSGAWDVDPEAVLGSVGPHMWGMYRVAR